MDEESERLRERKGEVLAKREVYNGFLRFRGFFFFFFGFIVLCFIIIIIIFLMLCLRGKLWEFQKFRFYIYIDNRKKVINKFIYYTNMMPIIFIIMSVCKFFLIIKLVVILKIFIL